MSSSNVPWWSTRLNCKLTLSLICYYSPSSLQNKSVIKVATPKQRGKKTPIQSGVCWSWGKGVLAARHNQCSCCLKDTLDLLQTKYLDSGTYAANQCVPSALDLLFSRCYWAQRPCFAEHMDLNKTNWSNLSRPNCYWHPKSFTNILTKYCLKWW